MKKEILTILLFASVLSVFSQNSIFPSYGNRPTWRMVSYEFFSAQPTWMTFRLDNDTMICNRNYQRIMFSSTDTNGIGEINYKPFRRIGFTRTENSKVFIRKTDKCTDKEFLMYDFSLKKGDSVFCGYSADFRIDTTKFYVTDVDSVVYLGIKRKRLKVWFNDLPNCTTNLPPCPDKYEMYWTEGIGTSRLGGFYPYLCLSPVCEEILYFICYEENGITKFQNPEFPNCSDFRTPINEVNKADLKIHLRTNIATHNLILDNEENEKLNVYVTNTLGQVLMAQTISNRQNTLNINQLSNGIYLIVFSKGNFRSVEKFIKN